jgi:hypothetical protein
MGTVNSPVQWRQAQLTRRIRKGERMDIEALRKMLQDTELEFEQAKAHIYRCEGVIKLLQHQIYLLENPPKPLEPAPPATE